MKIFLVGFMGSGKTSVGKRLVESIGFDFVDTDRFIEMQQGKTVAEIFAQRGETAFREMERNVLLNLQQHEYAVVSTGGGMPCHGDNMDLMLAGGRVVYLKTSPQALSRRLLRSHTERPLIKGKAEEELQQYIVEKLAEREPFYSRAHVTVQTENFSVEELVQTLRRMKF
ncbi:MAG: shikimate kinase [Bacteroidales bacterium]|jgi:shikimate kinase|nr:shikimate kinase [Bacteroidales bacterium]